MMYHPTILKLDSAAEDFHNAGMLAEKDAAHRLAGAFQQRLLDASPYGRKRRFLHAQWVWALGHIGLLYQLIRWFRLHEPDVELVLAADGSANPWFLQALAPFLSFVHPAEVTRAPQEPMTNALYFGCPDGLQSLTRFYKMIEQENPPHLLALSDAQQAESELLLTGLGVRRPFVALHARYSTSDTARNVTEAQIEDALAPYLAGGYSVVATGLDAHPATAKYASVQTLAEPHAASFLLSASCDKFIGSNSGAWVIAHAFQRPVEIMNDFARSAWIYP